MSVVLITGAGGLIGRALEKALKARKFEVRKLVRTREKANGVDSFYWNYLTRELQDGALTGVDYIINLSGANVSRWPWSASYKNEVYSSRIDSTRFLCEKVFEQNIPLKKFISASGIGVYGDTGSAVMNEDAPHGSDFLAQVCTAWEQEALAFGSRGIPVCVFRIGVVLTHLGGFLPKVSLPFKFYAGAVPGNGNQIISWIALDDLVGMFIYAVENNPVTGVFNACASQPVTMTGMMQAIARSMHRTLWVPNIPGWILKTVLGEMSLVVLAGCAADNTKIKNAGFGFQMDNLEKALES